MRTLCVLFIVICAACGTTTTETPSADTTANVSPSKVYNVSTSPADDVTLATIDMGDYEIRVHEIVKYAPSEMQQRLMKLDDTTKDYYIIDCSIRNKTANAVNTGRDLITAYFQLSDGSIFRNALRGAGYLASYNTDHQQKYPQQEYNMMWGKSFPGEKEARAHLLAVETPEGATITGIGFYEKTPEKNRFTQVK